ncbi:MAG TPA: presenilin family intramembrane aspartyl protease [Candidatus Nanoarchaeia archaeon]|nr:presenilin family intramembrane aspartyl protease [Candidatus Nanoarchaeia archaeon]
MKHKLPVFTVLLLIFLAAQVIGLLVIRSYIDAAATEKATQEAGRPVTVYKELPLGIERPDVEPASSYLFMAAAVIIGTLLLLLLIRFNKGALWKVWFLLAMVMTLTVAFTAFIPALLAALLAVIIALFRVFRPNIVAHNFGELFVYGGLAAIFVPVMNLKSAAILLIIIAVYDVFAVFQSKHMISLARFQSANRIFAGLMIPKELSMKTAFSQVNAATSTAPAKNKPAKSQKNRTRGQEDEYADSGSYAVIGGGDIGFPLLFAGAALSAFGFYKVLVIPVAATLALGVLLLIGKRGKFYPAMPFVAAGCFVGYGIASMF